MDIKINLFLMKIYYNQVPTVRTDQSKKPNIQTFKPTQKRTENMTNKTEIEQSK